MSTPVNVALLTVEDIADQFKVKQRKVYQLVRDRGLPYVRLGRQFRFRRADVDRWLAERTEVVPRPGAARASAEVPSYDWSKSRV